MKVTYVGRSTKGVEVLAAGVVVKPGETVDIDGEIARSLLRSGDWEKPTTPKTTESEADES